jgi:tripartite-type tricarboxylate transporter receptor subunit TctC
MRTLMRFRTAALRERLGVQNRLRERRDAAKVVALLCLAWVASPIPAAEYPSKPVRLIVGFPPGGGGDFIARLAGEALSGELHQNVVVDNRAGAGGLIGAELVARAAPDGYTLLVGTTGALSISPNLQANIPYNPVTDFTPVGMIGSVPNVVVVPAASPYRSVKDLIDAAKAKPGTLNYASTGVGATPHMAGEMLRVLANVQIVHVPYKGNGPAMIDLFAGRIDLMFPTIPSAISHVKAGRIRALAVTGDKPSAALPGVMTVGASGVPGYRVENWYGLLVPARTPQATVQALFNALNSGLAKRDMQERLTAQGIEREVLTPQQMSAFIKDEMMRWGRVVKTANIKIE